MSHYGHRMAKAEWGSTSEVSFVVELLIIRVFAQLGKIATNAFLGFHDKEGNKHKQSDNPPLVSVQPRHPENLWFGEIDNKPQS